MFLSVLLGTLWGCQAQENITEVRDGVTYVTNPRHRSHQDQATAPLRFELEQVFGVKEEPRQALLSGIGAVVTDDQGTVYVLDTRDNRLVAFNPDGSVRWQTGRQGQGPGEFQRSRGLSGTATPPSTQPTREADASTPSTSTEDSNTATF